MAYNFLIIFLFFMGLKNTGSFDDEFDQERLALKAQNRSDLDALNLNLTFMTESIKDSLAVQLGITGLALSTTLSIILLIGIQLDKKAQQEFAEAFHSMNQERALQLAMELTEHEIGLGNAVDADDSEEIALRLRIIARKASVLSWLANLSSPPGVTANVVIDPYSAIRRHIDNGAIHDDAVMTQAIGTANLLRHIAQVDVVTAIERETNGKVQLMPTEKGEYVFWEDDNGKSHFQPVDVYLRQRQKDEEKLTNEPS